MPLIITEIAIKPDGTVTIEVTNTGLGDVDVSDMILACDLVSLSDGTPAQYGISFANYGVSSIPAGASYTFGHTSHAADYTNATFDQVFDPAWNGE